MTDAEPMIETTLWVRLVPTMNQRGKVTRLDATSTKTRPTGKGAYVKMNIRVPRRLFEFPDTELEVDITDSMLEGSPAQIVADLADLRDSLS